MGLSWHHPLTRPEGLFVFGAGGAFSMDASAAEVGSGVRKVPMRVHRIRETPRPPREGVVCGERLMVNL